MEETVYLEVKGMHCAACATRIEKVVAKLEGVSDIHVNLTTEKGRVTFNKHRTGISTIVNRINKIGFEAKEVTPHNTRPGLIKQKEITALQWKLTISALLTLPLAWAMFAHFQWTSFIYVPELFTNPWFQLVITIPIQFVIGAPFYERAWKALKHGSANMDVLVVLSTSTAFFYSHYLTVTSLSSTNDAHTIELFYETSAFIITFILLGKLLEAKTKLKTTDALKKLQQLQTKTATLYVNGQQSTVLIEHIKPGDVIVLNPGDKVPIDGQVISGNSTIDESLLTGESIPVDKSSGSFVYAGTVNEHGTLTINVTKKASETTLSHIIRIVEEAQAFKAPIQHIADKITAMFVPMVIVTALMTFAAWYLVFQPGHINGALEKMIAVLIIACPCALGLATPTSITVGSGRAAQSGILFKEGRFLESLGKSNVVILDKTGTITRGEPEVTDIYTEHLSERAFLEIVRAVESVSRHPVAKAIVRKANNSRRALLPVTRVHVMPGYGVKASVNGKDVVIANPRYYMNNHISLPPKATSLVTKLEQEGKTATVVMIDHRFAGVITVADEIKLSALTAIARLQQMGLEVVMLTGDNASTANRVANRTGIQKHQAEVTPQEKAAIIQRLQHEGNTVMMVGDGINDAPALAVADVGIAIGTGSDVAIESGDVTVIRGDLNRVVEAMTISKKTMTNIKQNLLWAFLYNVMMIPFAMLGFLAPWLAAAAMAMSSVSVVLNSLRLKRVETNPHHLSLGIPSR